MQYRGITQEVRLRVYRKNGALDTYNKVVENVITKFSGDLDAYGTVCDSGSPPYCCENVTVNNPIQENDIIGVCMRDSGGHDPLYSLDEGAPASYTVYKVVENVITKFSGDLDAYGTVCDSGSPPYCCENVTVNNPIQENDIIGVCMRDSGGHDPLYSLDEGAPASYTVYQYPDTDNCNQRDDVDSFIASDPGISLTAQTGFGLHAHLSIVGKPQLVVKTHTRTSSSNTEWGC